MIWIELLLTVFGLFIYFRWFHKVPENNKKLVISDTECDAEIVYGSLHFKKCGLKYLSLEKTNAFPEVNDLTLTFEPLELMKEKK